ncbi:hypothetical protein BESB_027950 [Besnoitia besnoiti]|uniref:Uncharacterized protein n=1 Tax=Besnoitia besnoiti TaxID=94643 RepID=A0A2A9M7I9_BESBE|nr:uncharacterized protein BESB_027950 [Besnoitia besnoiti]PFH31360.1 hypothetical protein BESB_027950 [Besnoitia besnoiti]
MDDFLNLSGTKMSGQATSDQESLEEDEGPAAPPGGQDIVSPRHTGNSLSLGSEKATEGVDGRDHNEDVDGQVREEGLGQTPMTDGIFPLAERTVHHESSRNGESGAPQVTADLLQQPQTLPSTSPGKKEDCTNKLGLNSSTTLNASQRIPATLPRQGLSGISRSVTPTDHSEDEESEDSDDKYGSVTPRMKHGSTARLSMSDSASPDLSEDESSSDDGSDDEEGADAQQREGNPLGKLASLAIAPASDIQGHQEDTQEREDGSAANALHVERRGSQPPITDTIPPTVEGGNPSRDLGANENLVDEREHEVGDGILQQRTVDDNQSSSPGAAKTLCDDAMEGNGASTDQVSAGLQGDSERVRSPKFTDCRSVPRVESKPLEATEDSQSAAGEVILQSPPSGRESESSRAQSDLFGSVPEKTAESLLTDFEEAVDKGSSSDPDVASSATPSPEEPSPSEATPRIPSFSAGCGSSNQSPSSAQDSPSGRSEAESPASLRDDEGEAGGVFPPGAEAWPSDTLNGRELRDSPSFGADSKWRSSSPPCRTEDIPASRDLSPSPPTEAPSPAPIPERDGMADSFALPSSAGGQDGYERLPMKAKLRMFEEISKQRSAEISRSFSASMGSRRADGVLRASSRRDVSPRRCDPPSETALRERDEQIAKLIGLLKHRTDTLGAVGDQLEKKERTLKTINEENASLTREFLDKLASTVQEQRLPTLPAPSRSTVATSWLAQEAWNEEAKQEAAARLASCSSSLPSRCSSNAAPEASSTLVAEPALAAGQHAPSPQVSRVVSSAPSEPDVIENAEKFSRTTTEQIDQPDESEAPMPSSAVEDEGTRRQSTEDASSIRNEPDEIEQDEQPGLQGESSVICPSLQDKVKWFEDLQNREGVEERQKPAQTTASPAHMGVPSHEHPDAGDTSLRRRDSSISSPTQHPLLAEKDAEIARLLALVKHKEDLIDLAKQGVAEKEEEILARLAQKFSLSRDYMHYLAEHHEKAPEILRTGKSFCRPGSSNNREASETAQEVRTGSLLQRYFEVGGALNMVRVHFQGVCSQSRPGAREGSRDESRGKFGISARNGLGQSDPINRKNVADSQRGSYGTRIEHKNKPHLQKLSSKVVAPLRNLATLEEWLSEEFSAQEKPCSDAATMEMQAAVSSEGNPHSSAWAGKETKNPYPSLYPEASKRPGFTTRSGTDGCLTGDRTMRCDDFLIHRQRSLNAKDFEADDLRAEEEAALEALRQYAQRQLPATDAHEAIPDSNDDCSANVGVAGTPEGQPRGHRAAGRWHNTVLQTSFGDTAAVNASPGRSERSRSGIQQSAFEGGKSDDSEEKSRRPTDYLSSTSTRLRASARPSEGTRGDTSSGQSRETPMFSHLLLCCAGAEKQVQYPGEEQPSLGESTVAFPGLASFWREALAYAGNEESEDLAQNLLEQVHRVPGAAHAYETGNIHSLSQGATGTAHAKPQHQSVSMYSTLSVSSHSEGKKLKAELFFKTLLDKTKARVERYMKEAELRGLFTPAELNRALRTYDDVKQMAMEVRDTRKENQILRQAMLDSSHKMETIVDGLQEMNHTERLLPSSRSAGTSALRVRVPGSQRGLSDPAFDANRQEDDVFLSPGITGLPSNQQTRKSADERSASKGGGSGSRDDGSMEPGSPVNISITTSDTPQDIRVASDSAAQPNHFNATRLHQATRLIQIQEKRIAALQEQLYELTKRCMYLEELDDTMWGLIEERMENDARTTEKIKETYERSCAELRARLGQ